jgi:uncharacterized protein YjiS (DUF1127 family)
MSQTLTAKMPAPLWHGLKMLGWFLAVRAARIGTALKNRRDALALANFDDRSLADIGLTRSDLRDAYSEPLWRDPTAILAKRASERHAHRRRLNFSLSLGVFSAPPLAPEQGYRLPETNRPSRYAI